jgi:diguanylate cyclase (GGDEF)-like protein
MIDTGKEPDPAGLILLVDDEVTNIEVMASVLDGQCDIAFATSGAEALDLVKEISPDLILLDIVMPGMDGYEVCRRLKADPRAANIPVIFVSALDGTDDETKGLGLGAIDYVSKPIRPAIVKARVRNHLNLKRAHDMLERLSATDGLTGVANRRRLEEVIELEFARQTRSQEPLSVIMLDVDHFKSFNDTYGHAAGDECLKQIAATLRRTLRQQVDLVARYGGEEFMCVLPNSPHALAVEVAERIRTQIAAMDIEYAGSPPPVVSASLGVATAEFGQDITPAQFMDQADQRLYAAKRAGRNRVCG